MFFRKLPGMPKVFRVSVENLNSVTLVIRFVCVRKEYK